MKRQSQNNHGFTLVELMITVVIVGILASVAIPLYQGNVRRAKATEADAALGSIRTSLRVFYAENGSYPTATEDAPWDIVGLDIDSLDLAGKYFSASSYKITSTAVAFTIQATGSGPSANINRQIVTDGTLSSF